ncbi:MAG: cation:dicarboxylase symporter family transporter, partial [Proteobacteria bacterium]|nr:cation:dicarboxylase symporter family transporter [Pseudomonadota bacterium]
VEIFMNFIFFIIFLQIFIILALNFILARKIKMKYFDVLNKIKQTLFIAVSTSSTIGTMPIYMETLQEKFGFESNKIQLFVPVTLTTIRFSYIFYFSALSIFAVHVFSMPLSLSEYIMLPFLIVFGSFAAVSSGIININILSMILQPLGVPSSLIISIFSVLDPLFDPLRMIFGFYMNFFTLAYSLPKKEGI